ncbi:MAG: membrane protein insertase YidC [Candidatus Omnitrophica bacterium]|nr:membrane protein insertase YidC [Candidatus Omnitrophota bacterium]
MEKRLLLAIGLSLLVLISWSAFTSKMQPVDNKTVTTNKELQKEAVQFSKEVSDQPALPSETKASLIKIDRNNMDLYFDETHAAINKVVFKGFQDHVFPLKWGLFSDDINLKYVQAGSGPEKIVFVAKDSSKRVTKSFIFPKSSYLMELQITIENLSPSALSIKPSLVLGVLNFSGNNVQSRYQDIYVVNPEKSLHLSVAKKYRGDKTKILGLRDQYFCLIAEPVKKDYSSFVDRLDNSESKVGLYSDNIVIPAKGQIGHLFNVYIGPQDLKLLNSINSNWAGIIYYGTFDFISQLLLQALEFLYSLFHNWGWAIVVLSILVYFILYPLSVKQMRSMKEMQAIQPKVEELRKLYKDNPQKMNKEIMELYRLHKVNPLGGCLPLLLQMPIFFALYNALMRSVVLKGAKFLWIKDLSEPDRLFALPVSLPMLGNEFNILPIIMALGMFFQQRLTTTSASGASAEQQKMMLIIMPIIFGIIFYRMPSGLVLYWLTNSVLMLVFQLRMNRAR